jgi:AraC family transcriptional regulator, transcriptional activator of pobA
VNSIENLDIGHVKHAFDNNFKVQISEASDSKSLETDFPHRHNFFMICLVINGNGIHVIDFEKIEIKPCRLFFIKPEQVHFWNVHPNSKLAIIQFSTDFLTQLFTLDSIPSIQSASTSYIDLDQTETQKIVSVFQKIDDEKDLSNYNSFKIVQAYIFILLAEIERFLNPESIYKRKGNRSEILENFKRLLNKRYKELTSVSDYSQLLNITPNYLNIVIKQSTGYTANELLHQRIVLEAKRQLININTDITQIAFDLGFKDASYFSRFFKKETGSSPSGFRQNVYKMYQHHNK